MKKGRNSGENEEDGRRLWQTVTRSVKPYAAPKKPLPASRAPPAKRDAKKRKSHSRLPGMPGGGSAEAKSARGRLPLEGRLDLHGLTQAEAFATLHRFLAAAVAAEKRTLLIITGKGARSEGILKRMLPLWLEESPFKKHILALTPAPPKDGGDGAFCLRLRKRR